MTKRVYGILAAVAAIAVCVVATMWLTKYEAIDYPDDGDVWVTLQALGPRVASLGEQIEPGEPWPILYAPYYVTFSQDGEIVAAFESDPYSGPEGALVPFRLGSEPGEFEVCAGAGAALETTSCETVSIEHGDSLQFISASLLIRITNRPVWSDDRGLLTNPWQYGDDLYDRE